MLWAHSIPFSNFLSIVLELKSKIGSLFSSPEFDAVFSVQFMLPSPLQRGGEGEGLPVEFWDSSLK